MVEASGQEPTLDELKAQADAAMDERARFIDSVEPPLSEEENRFLEELTIKSVEAHARYFQKRDNR
jgi:hypothetical protein